MSDEYDDGGDFDPTDESDPTVRALRLEVVRLEAQLDQLLAGEAQRAAEARELRERLDELELRIAALEEWRKKMPRRMIGLGLAAALFGTAAANVIAYLLGW